jgi:hypothetical protein
MPHPFAMSLLCGSRDENIAEIVADWKRLTDRAPWRSLSDTDWVNHLAPLLSAIFDAGVCGGGSHKCRRRVIEAAMEHGEQRRAQGLAIDVLLDEHNELRNAVWRFLSRRAGRELSDEFLAEIVRFDAAGTFAAMGSLRGYYRLEIERERDWGCESDRIVADWEETSVTGDGTASPS